MERDKNYFEKKGKTAENILHNLAKKTFLSDWCYLNPKPDEGKELCDLFILKKPPSLKVVMGKRLYQ